jgi:hypothetical protein
MLRSVTLAAFFYALVAVLGVSTAQARDPHLKLFTGAYQGFANVGYIDGTGDHSIYWTVTIRVNKLGKVRGTLDSYAPYRAGGPVSSSSRFAGSFSRTYEHSNSFKAKATLHGGFSEVNFRVVKSGKHGTAILLGTAGSSPNDDDGEGDRLVIPLKKMS